MKNTIAARGDDSRTPTTVVQNYFTADNAREGFSATVHDFTARQLKKAAGNVSIDAAKSWIAASRTPSLHNAVNMARSLPCVSEWLAEKCGWRAVQATSADAVIRWAREYRKASGMDGDVARAVLAAVAGIEPEPKPRVVTEAVVLDRWRFLDLAEDRDRNYRCEITEDIFERRRA